MLSDVSASLVIVVIGNPMKSKKSMPKHRRRIFRALRRVLPNLGNANCRAVMHKRTNRQLEIVLKRLIEFRNPLFNGTFHTELE